MSRYLLYLYIILGLALIISTKSEAANDLEKWNSEKGRVARTAMKEKLATTTYREMPNHVDSSYRSTANGGKVLRQLETSAEIKGSRVGATIDALKEVDKYAAAKKWAKELGKGGVRFTAGAVLIEAAMQAMLDSVGWVIDEGGKVTKNPDAESDSDVVSPSDQYCFSTDGGGCRTKTALIKYVLSYNWPGWIYQSHTCPSGDDVYCVATISHSGAPTRETGVRVIKKSNPNYDPAHKPESDPVPEAEMIEKIRDYFENPQSPASKDLLIEQAEKPKGKASIMWSDDPSSEQTIYSDNKKTTEKVLSSDDPVGDGLTKKTPTIIDGTTVNSETTTNTETNTNVNENTVINPDGSTTTTGTNVSNTTNITNNTFELPAACDYFAKLCDWLDWTKEEPELTDENLQVEEQDITDYKYEDHVQFGSSCPFQEEIKDLNMGVGTIRVKYNLDFFCTFGHSAKSTIVALGHLGALIFLMFGIRSGNG
ncbi:hypothetical protein [Acinetobacter tianfuensis]|uniref:Uncharacterized protein n=1 Tax=Acinetobacter tianfuensis TaxID=2419603 RepID=A0A3A8E4H7_9GAMM|nr:hypothetical protein [Acinetobacter tianfuensis]RKG29058.1 hypothetical protein D7V32_16715 [Acinetobacter tianfuensis]